MKRKEINTLKNPWMKATIILGTALLIMFLADAVNEVKKTNDYQSQQEQLYESGKYFLDFASENHLGEVCNIDQRVCCNTQTGECWRV